MKVIIILLSLAILSTSSFAQFGSLKKAIDKGKEVKKQYDDAKKAKKEATEFLSTSNTKEMGKLLKEAISVKVKLKSATDSVSLPEIVLVEVTDTKSGWFVVGVGKEDCFKLATESNTSSEYARKVKLVYLDGDKTYTLTDVYLSGLVLRLKDIDQLVFERL